MGGVENLWMGKSTAFRVHAESQIQFKKKDFCIKSKQNYIFGKCEEIQIVSSGQNFAFTKAEWSRTLANMLSEPLFKEGTML